LTAEIAAEAPIGPPLPLPARLAPQYPVIYTLGYPGRQSRWKAALRLVLLLPELLALALVYSLLYPLAFASWLIIVFSGRLDRTLWGFSASILRWIAAVLSYATLLRDEYPGLGQRFPQRFAIAFPPRRSRVRTLFRAVLILPQLVVVELLFLPLLVGALIAWVAILIEGRYPEGIWRLVAGLNRWILRVAAYGLLLRDDYPPYTLGLWEPATLEALGLATAPAGTAMVPAVPAAEPAVGGAPLGRAAGIPIWPVAPAPGSAAEVPPPAPGEGALYERPWPQAALPPTNEPEHDPDQD